MFAGAITSQRGDKRFWAPEVVPTRVTAKDNGEEAPVILIKRARFGMTFPRRDNGDEL